MTRRKMPDPPRAEGAGAAHSAAERQLKTSARINLNFQTEHEPMLRDLHSPRDAHKERR